jgi:hypothetical protein
MIGVAFWSDQTYQRDMKAVRFPFIRDPVDLLSMKPRVCYTRRQQGFLAGVDIV